MNWKVPGTTSVHRREPIQTAWDERTHVQFTGADIDFVPIVTGPARDIVYGLPEFKRQKKFEREQNAPTVPAFLGILGSVAALNHRLMAFNPPGWGNFD